MEGCVRQATSGAGSSPAPGKVVVSDRLPLIAPGAHIRADVPAEARLSRQFRLPTPGVWYVFLRIGSADGSALLSYAVDDTPPLKSNRGRIPITKGARNTWVRRTLHKLRDEDEGQTWFDAEIHVDEPGDHTLHITALQGRVSIDKVALTLHHSAKPSADKLDHSGDPGEGSAVFAQPDRRVDGFRKDWKSPEVKAKRSFYVDAAQGDDKKDGLSPGSAWRTFSNVNGREFQPGDAILLRRGGRWQGGLSPKGSGTSKDWITIGAYGEGPRPLIDGKTRDGVHLEQQSYWIIQDLELTSDGSHDTCGLAALSRPKQPQPKGIKIYNVIAYDNGPCGIYVGSRDGESNGYDGVLVENCLAYYHDQDGIAVGGSDQNGCRNTVIRYCTAYSNLYSAGMWIFGGQNGLIEHSLAYNNACVNIWTWNAINVTIRYCEAYRGRTPRDASGFDIDWGCEACTVEYCYSHHNQGDGYLAMGHGEANYRGFPQQSRYNLLRYCISENDSAPLSCVETFEHGKIYNNLFIASGKTHVAGGVGGWPKNEEGDSGGWPADTEFVNNIFIGRNGATPAWVDDYAATSNRNLFNHNLYQRIGTEGPLIRWGGRRNGPGFWKGENNVDIQAPIDYSSLEAFQKATGQEAHGLGADPKLAGPFPGEYGRLPLSRLRGAADSPAARAGKPVPLSAEWLAARAKYLTDTGAEAWGIPMVPGEVQKDYWGRPLSPKAAPPIGPGTG
jgi:hypothetical protein